MHSLPFVGSKALAPLACASALILCLSVINPAPAKGADTSGLLGSLLSETQKHSDLFTFFHLEQTGTSTDATGARVVAFKPSGPDFRPLVTLNVTVDKDGAISQIELLLARSFIEDKNNGIFARDIAKTILRDTVPAADQNAIADLANEIEYHHGTDRTVLLARPVPKLPDPPTAGYLAFLGKQQAFEQDLTGAQLRLENRKAGGTDVLAITVSPR